MALPLFTLLARASHVVAAEEYWFAVFPPFFAAAAIASQHGVRLPVGAAFFGSSALDDGAALALATGSADPEGAAEAEADAAGAAADALAVNSGFGSGATVAGGGVVGAAVAAGGGASSFLQAMDAQSVAAMRSKDF
jgi:hypothetical protein